MIKLYGSKLWPGCKPAKEFLLQNNIDFKYIEITEDIMHLKEFLKLRDFNSSFDIVKRNSNVGIPALVVDDTKVYFYFNDKLINILKGNK